MKTTVQNQMEVIEHLFDEKIQLTGVTEFGVSLDEIIKGQSQLPPEGARFNIAFEGRVEGPEISGTKRGIDYLEVRPDGKLILRMQAVITTDDGENIAVYEDGINTLAGNGSTVGELSLNMHMHTASPKYNWVNKIQVWCKGFVDMEKGKARVSAFRS